MKKNKLLLLLFILLTTSCNGKNSHIYVSSIITNKWDRYWTQIVYTGKVYTYIPHYDCYFQFNEWKPYTKKVMSSDYKKFEIGDIYTFTISTTEKEYFFDDSISIVES